MTEQHQHDDQDLRERFAELGREEEQGLPPFTLPEPIEISRKASPLIWAVAGTVTVAATVVFATMFLLQRQEDAPVDLFSSPDEMVFKEIDEGESLIAESLPPQNEPQAVAPPPAATPSPGEVVTPSPEPTLTPDDESDLNSLGYIADTAGDGDPTVHGSREMNFKTSVGGISNQDPLAGLDAARANYDTVEETTVTTALGEAYRRAAEVPPDVEVLIGDPDPGNVATYAPNVTAKRLGLKRAGVPKGYLSPEPPSAESYAPIRENPFHLVVDEPLSTFSADVDTASYANVRRFLNQGQRPPRDAVRIEELINYFDYGHPTPAGDDPFGVEVEVADCPWNPEHRLARIHLAARRELRNEYLGSNLIFLLDVSGSMDSPNKLPLVQGALSLLADQLDSRDTVSIVVYAGASGMVLSPTPGSDRATIREALARLDAGGSTAGAEGLRLAYRTARENFIEGGVNRVILATDGDFNIGVTSHSELLDIIKKDADRGIHLTALGFGMGNYQDDRLEQLADRGNGNYAYIDDLREARKVLVEEIGGTLVTVAKDVKLQIEFNPATVGAYRLVGYENRLLAHRDFNDDTKDAGEIGAGHTVTAFYELIPPGKDASPEVDPLRYQERLATTKAAEGGELFTLKIRFKRPAERVSALRSYPVHDEGLPLKASSEDFRFAAAVAALGMRLRNDPAAADLDWERIERMAAESLGDDEHGHRAGFVDLLRRAAETSPGRD